jgi:hypothetical protein
MSINVCMSRPFRCSRDCEGGVLRGARGAEFDNLGIL